MSKDFCNDCPHKNVDDILKELFNEYVQKTFLECPVETENIIGCLIKQKPINWENFLDWCVKEGVATRGDSEEGNPSI